MYLLWNFSDNKGILSPTMLALSYAKMVVIIGQSCSLHSFLLMNWVLRSESICYAVLDASTSEFFEVLLGSKMIIEKK